MATRKQRIAEDTAPDPFLEKSARVADFIEAHGRTIAIGGVAVLGLCLAYLGFADRSVRTAAKATSALTAAVDTYTEVTDPLKVATSTVPAASKKAAPDARGAFETLIKEHGDVGVGLLARIYAGDLARRSGEPKAAEAHFVAYLAAATADDSLRFVALEGAGYAAEEQGNHEAAAKYFRSLAALPNGFYKDQAQMHLARVLKAKGDTQGAMAAYQVIVDELEDSTLAAPAKKQLEALKLN